MGKKTTDTLATASLHVRFGRTTFLAEISEQRGKPTLLVVTTRRPIVVAPGAVFSCIADWDELAAAAAAERSPLDFSAGGLDLRLVCR